MPIYEYECTKCGDEFELLVATNRSSPPCPSCGSRKLSRRISTFASHQGRSSLPGGCAESACPGAASCRETGQCPMA